jgi:hypothetical protein
VIDKNVGGLDVAVDDVAAVQEFYRTQRVVHYDFDMSLLQPTLTAGLDQVLQVVI